VPVSGRFVYPQQELIDGQENRMRIRVTAGIAVVLLLPLACLAQDGGLSLEQALELARQRAPVILAARDRIEEVRGRLLGATMRFRDNPVIEGAAGPRTSERGTSIDADVGISQTFELGGRRTARIADAQADIERETATSENTARFLLRDVAAEFLRALAVQERLRSLETASTLAGNLLTAADTRFQAGDVPILDVNLARTVAARARSEMLAGEAEQISVLGDLRILLGMTATEPLAIRGELGERSQYDVDALQSRALDRPDLRALAAEIRQAEADLRLGRGLAKPEIGLGVGYQREEGANVALGRLAITLPVFSRGQELQATSMARATRLTRELEFGRRAIAVEIRSAFDAYQRQVRAVEELERDALPNLEENRLLAQRSYEEGEIGITDLLLFQRESIETQLLYVDRLMEAALAGIELEYRSGAFQ
jgi:outer membrane protein, heavy metal efflux system